MQTEEPNSTPLHFKKRKFVQLDDTRATCTEIEQTLKQILHHKQTNPDSTDWKPLWSYCSLLFIDLKRKNRQVQFETEKQKNETSKQKHHLDQLNQELNSLLYEKEYLLREIQRIKDYKSKQALTEVISEEEFAARAPGQGVVDEHQKLLNRLNFELQERKNLCKQLDELKARKKVFADHNLKKKTRLDGLQSCVKTISKAVVPIEGFVPLQVPKQNKQNNLAYYLPFPLYNLYYQAYVYKEAFEGAKMELSVLGNVDDVVGDKSRTVDKTKIYQPHPLSVSLEPIVADVQRSLKIKFEFLEALNLVVVSTNDGMESVLINLFPNDSGLISPNPAAQEFKLEENVKGRPYKWAQWLGGFNYIYEETAASPGSRKVHYPFSVVMEKIQKRILNSNALQTQLRSLAQRCITPESKPRQCLGSWLEIAKTEYEGMDLQQETRREEGELSSIPQSGAKSYGHRYYRAIFKGKTVEFNALVDIGPEYPEVAPAFRLKLSPSHAPGALTEQLVKQLKDTEVALNSQAKADENVLSVQMSTLADWVESLGSQAEGQ